MQIFFRHPASAFYGRELARLADIQLNAIRREIANLEQVGVIIQSSSNRSEDEPSGTGRSKYYQLNGASLLLPELQALLLKAQVLEEQEFVSLIKKRAGRINFFLLTGLFTNTENAVTDMLLVGNIKETAVARLIKEFEASIGATIRYTVMSEKEFAERREIGDKFLYSVLEGKHVMVADDYRLG